jgi:hypothetical protein
VSAARKEIVAGKAGVVRPEQSRGDDERQHRGAEQAGPCLLQAEHQELDQRSVKAVRRKPVEHLMGGSVDPCFDRGETLKAWDPGSAY